MKVILPDGKVKTIHKLHYVDSTGHAYTIYRGRYVCETNNLFNINVIRNNYGSTCVYENSFYNHNYCDQVKTSEVIKYVKSLFKPGTTYTISANVAPNNGGIQNIGLVWDSGWIDLIKNYQNNYTRLSNTVQVTEESLSELNRIEIFYGNRYKYSTWQNVQIEEGSTATPFKGYRHILFY